MGKLLNGNPEQTPYVTFQQFYDEHNERQKADLRAKLSQIFLLSEVSIFRKIRLNDFDTKELRTMYVHYSIAHCSKRGFFLDTDVSKMETMNKYKLTL